MPLIVISASSKLLLDAHALGGVCRGAKRLRDGSFEIELDEDILERMHRVSGDPDDAIRILCTHRLGLQ